MNPRIALRLAAERRRETAADKACPELLRVRVPAAQRVLCDVDLNKKPLIPRQHQDAVAMVVYGALMTFLLIACAFFGGLS